jgi:hypothetical protein
MTTRRQHLRPGTPQEPLAQRLWRDMAEGLAAHAGCCPVHGTRLICAWCDITWTASAHEKVEVEALLERTALYDLTWPMWPCGRCGTQDIALCLDCYEPVREQALASLSSDEGGRLRTLLGTSMRYTCMPDPDAAEAQTGAHEGGETP